MLEMQLPVHQSPLPVHLSSPSACSLEEALLKPSRSFLKLQPPGDVAAETPVGEADESGSPNRFVSPAPALSLSP